MSKWNRITEEVYDDALCCLPPEVWQNNGFLIGEPTDHEGGAARYGAYFRREGKYYSAGLMTVLEFIQTDPNFVG